MNTLLHDNKNGELRFYEDSLVRIFCIKDDQAILNRLLGLRQGLWICGFNAGSEEYEELELLFRVVNHREKS